MSSNLDRIHESIQATTKLVLLGPQGPDEPPGDGDGEVFTPAPSPTRSPSAYQQAVDKAVQSVAQTTALALQDASNMMRNVATVEVTAIGVATAKWIQDPSSHDYPRVINDSLSTINKAADAYKHIGEAVIGILEQLKTPQGDRSGG